METMLFSRLIWQLELNPHTHNQLTLQPKFEILFVRHKNRLQSLNFPKNSSMTRGIDIWSSTLATKSCCTPEICHYCTASASLRPDGWVPSALVLAGAPTRICWMVSLLGWRASTLSSTCHSSNLATCLMPPLHLTNQAECHHPLGRMKPGLKLMHQKNLKWTSSEPREDMALEGSTS